MVNQIKSWSDQKWSDGKLSQLDKKCTNPQKHFQRGEKCTNPQKHSQLNKKCTNPQKQGLRTHGPCLGPWRPSEKIEVRHVCYRFVLVPGWTNQSQSKNWCQLIFFMGTKITWAAIFSTRVARPTMRCLKMVMIMDIAHCYAIFLSSLDVDNSL